ADEGGGAIDHQQLAVHAPEQLEADAHRLRARIKAAYLDTRLGHGHEEPVRERRRAVAIDQNRHAHAAPGGGHQALLQLPADLVLEQDEGLQQDFAARGIDGLEHRGIEALAVLQQAHAVALVPAQLHAASPDSRACSGRWSDSRVPGWPRGVATSCTCRPRTELRSSGSNGSRAGKLRASRPRCCSKASTRPQSSSWRWAAPRQSLKSPATTTGASAGTCSRSSAPSRPTWLRRCASRSPRCTQMACRCCGWPGSSSSQCSRPRFSWPATETSWLSWRTIGNRDSKALPWWPC